MGRRGLLSATLAGALLVAGCGGGDDDQTLTFSGSDEEQIAGTVNTMTAAIAGGDGATACELMTERGQRVMLRVGRQGGGADVGDCAEAVPVAQELGFDPGDYRIKVENVKVDSDSPDRAEAACDINGAFLLERTDAGWQVETPYCSH